MQELMSPAQSAALEIYLQSANFDNNFTPLSERALQDELKKRGFEVGSGSIHRWKVKFKWAQLLENAVNSAIVDDKNVQTALKNSSLQSAVKNTKVDLDRNNIILAACYEIGEIELAELLQKRRDSKLSNAEFDRFYKLMKMAKESQDRMLDRLANMPKEYANSDEVFKRLSFIDVDIEERGDNEVVNFELDS